MNLSESSMVDTKSCELDFVTTVCLVRQRSGEGEGFDLSKFIGRSLFLPKESEIGICG